MATILIKDKLRQSVEAASGGLQTIVYTAKGQPCFMNIISRFYLSEIDAELSGAHPAFIIDGVEYPQILIGTYQSFISNGEMVSQPYTAPTRNTMTQSYAIQTARAAGKGFHAITNAEWAALQCLAWKNGQYPKGSNKDGADSSDASLYGVRTDGKLPGVSDGGGLIYAGSGPSEFRHNLAYNGISDLNGNANEHVTGVRSFYGELQVLENNNAASQLHDLLDSSQEWKAISGVDGALMAPDGKGTTTGSIKLVSGSAASTVDYTLTSISGAFQTATILNTTGKMVSNIALKKLRVLGLYPYLSNAADFFMLNHTKVGYAQRGGSWINGGSAGINAMTIANQADNATVYITSRLAYYSAL